MFNPLDIFAYYVYTADFYIYWNLNKICFYLNKFSINALILASYL